jgi:hypothetical protein
MSAPVFASITEISLESVPGYVRNPHRYALILHSNGVATYISDGADRRKGTYCGNLLASDFGQLARLVLKSKFLNADPFYGTFNTDIPYWIVSVVRGGKRKTLVDSGKPRQPDDKEAPKALQELERRMQMLVAKPHWEKVGNKTETPSHLPTIPMHFSQTLPKRVKK